MQSYLAYVLNPELIDLAKDIQKEMVRGGCVKSEVIEKKEYGGKPWRIEVVGIFNKGLDGKDLMRNRIKNLIQNQYHRVIGKSEICCSLGDIWV